MINIFILIKFIVNIYVFVFSLCVCCLLFAFRFHVRLKTVICLLKIQNNKTENHKTIENHTN